MILFHNGEEEVYYVQRADVLSPSWRQTCATCAAQNDTGLTVNMSE